MGGFGVRLICAFFVPSHSIFDKIKSTVLIAFIESLYRLDPAQHIEFILMIKCSINNTLRM